MLSRVERITQEKVMTSMKKLIFALLLFVGAGIPSVLFWLTVGNRIVSGGAVKPALLCAGLLLGNLLLWRFAVSERFHPHAWFGLKVLLFNGGSMLLIGLLFATPADSSRVSGPRGHRHSRREQALRP